MYRFTSSVQPLFLLLSQLGRFSLLLLNVLLSVVLDNVVHVGKVTSNVVSGSIRGHCPVFPVSD